MTVLFALCSLANGMLITFRPAPYTLHPTLNTLHPTPPILNSPEL